jgi:outer membrane protein assembly factor BamB
MYLNIKKLGIGCLLLCIFSVGFSQEIAQWRGPARDGIYPETGLLKKWAESGPTLKLKIEGIGKGYSHPVVYKNNIYVTGLKSDTLDYISAYKMTGELLWSKAYARAWANTFPETRCTPTIENDRIYLIGGMGVVVCMDANTGNILWSQDAHKQFHGEYNKWGLAESVLLTDNGVTYVTGGDETSVVAFDKLTGKLLWKTKSLGGPRAYCSSALIEWNGSKMILAQTANDLMGINPENGEILWNYNIVQFHKGESGRGAITLTPIFHNGEIFTNSGYDHPATMFTLAKDGKSVTLKWKNDIFDTHHGGVVLIDGNLYGSNWETNSKGKWASINWETGKTNWEKDWINKGSIIAADGLLYCYDEQRGNVALVQPDVNDFKIISTFKIKDGEGPYWAHPAIYNKMLFIRHGNVLLIYDIKA